MVMRNSRGFFGSFVVFPGGRVDDIDAPTGATPTDEMSHRRAAIRELSEEAGLLATRSGVVEAPAAKGTAFYEWLDTSSAVIDTDRLVLVSRWVTPEGAPRRFDTRFYLLSCDADREVRIDTDELVDYAWATPVEALTRYRVGEWPMILPTLAHLRWLAKRSSIEDAFASAHGADGRSLIEPRRADDGSIIPVYLPADV